MSASVGLFTRESSSVISRDEGKMDGNLKETLKKVANTIRGLSVDAIEKAKSGHPGLPLGCAEIGAYLYGVALNHNPKNPLWINRDRFVLAAGHGSMLLYSCLHLAGFNFSLEDIKNFRTLHSKTPGHPEYDIQHGIEATSGPLGQGVGNAVGLALAYKILAANFNTRKVSLFDNKIYCLMSDGCVMEGATSEVSSLAGHLNLNNLIVFYDSNNICLDGNLSETSSEDTKNRYYSYGWDVFEIDGYDFEAMHSIVSELKKNQDKPVLILAHTLIGKGSPNKEGTHKVHGAPLGKEEVLALKEELKISKEEFYRPQQILDFFEKKRQEQKKQENNWNDLFRIWGKDNPELLEKFKAMQEKKIPEELEGNLKKIPIKTPIAGRSASNEIINYLAELMPYFYGGSADLASSDMTSIKKEEVISQTNFKGRNIKYGVREFAMGTISNGLALSGMILPLAGTFLVFSDYMRNAIRLAALSKLQVVYQLTHDSIFLGQDGPTHQPVEHLASLRAMPGLQVIRPADSKEVKMAWMAALKYKGPTALILSRQALPDVTGTDLSYEEGVGRGAYIVKKEKEKADFTLFATGSEVQLALEVAERLEKLDKQVRVISVPCFELFEKQPKEYKEEIIGKDIGKRVSIEAGVELGWYKFIGRDGVAISVESFGLSASYNELAAEFGFTPDSILQRIL